MSIPTKGKWSKLTKKTINFRNGIEQHRGKWIGERGDTEILDSFSSSYCNKRLNDESLDGLRFEHILKPRRAKSGKNELFKYQ